MSISESTNEGLLSAAETAELLGVKRDTLYAYVSRGLLQSVTRPDSRERGYRRAEVERFRAGRGAIRLPTQPNEALTPVIDSAIGLIENGRFYYRGRDAIHLAATASLENIAELLWEDGPRPDTTSSPPPPPFPPPRAGEGQGGGKRGSRATSRSPALGSRFRGNDGFKRAQPAGLIERCQLRLAMAAAADLAALDLSRAGVARTGWKILAELVRCVAEDARDVRPVHERLAASWRLDPAGGDLVRRILVLLADHELNASTFVARCVASTGATPYAVVSAALSALSGRRHGGASARAEALFREIGTEGDPMAMMAARLARDETLPGLGQPLYPQGDPRAGAILEALAAFHPDTGARYAAAAAAGRQLTGQYPNVDFALGAAVVALSLPPGSAIGLFLVARTVGWIAHAIEQYESPVLIRPRARYTGGRPFREGSD